MNTIKTKKKTQKTKRNKFDFDIIMVEGSVYVDARTLIQLLYTVCGTCGLPKKDLVNTEKFENFVNGMEA